MLLSLKRELRFGGSRGPQLDSRGLPKRARGHLRAPRGPLRGPVCPPGFPLGRLGTPSGLISGSILGPRGFLGADFGWIFMFGCLLTAHRCRVREKNDCSDGGETWPRFSTGHFPRLCSPGCNMCPSRLRSAATRKWTPVLRAALRRTGFQRWVETEKQCFQVGKPTFFVSRRTQLASFYAPGGSSCALRRSLWGALEHPRGSCWNRFNPRGATGA